ncbi:uncharacterized protein [Gossypium hirsutum]|uniref:Uncharacterized protein n=1 Tax=Gossypium hirsutum TaxID=3635 RepID=A0ABM2ZBU8_GOSHI|nr:uncharacterized protein LOC121211437 [Gossypium hirsutum]
MGETYKVDGVTRMFIPVKILRGKREEILPIEHHLPDLPSPHPLVSLLFLHPISFLIFLLLFSADFLPVHYASLLPICSLRFLSFLFRSATLSIAFSTSRPSLLTLVSIPNPSPTTLLHPRREPFENGLLPIQKLIFTDPLQALTSLKQKLVSSSTQRVDSAALADALEISLDHARLVLDTLASVLHSESDLLVTSRFDDVDSVGADLLDLILFLYIQSYKRLLPRSHKDAAAVADVWPSTSFIAAF